MPSAEAVGEQLKDFAPAVSWLLVICGWLVVSRDHNKREVRKEVRAQIGKIQELTDRLEALAFKYWTTPPDTESGRIAADLKRDLQRLARQLTRLAKSCQSVSVQGELIEFRRAITGGDFESKTRTSLSTDAGRLYEIWGCAQDLIEKIETGFAEKYPAK